MFGPKHTIETVTKDLIERFDEGTVVLQPEEYRKLPLGRVRALFQEALNRSRGRERGVVWYIVLMFLLGSAFLILDSLGLFGEIKILRYVANVLIGISLVWLILKGIKIRERTVELKTIRTVLESLDDDDSSDVVPRIMVRLPSRMTELHRR
jgi:uncharacterized membrane protein YuzA (DUF378 family)